MKNTESKRKNFPDMGFGLIAAGFVFLFNPVYHVIDVLPDFIGFFLIWRGLSRISAIEYDLENSRNLIKWLVVTEIIKPFTIVLMRGSGTVGMNPPDGLLPVVHDNTKLLLTFVFSVIELIIFIPAIKKMFSGLDRLGIKYSSRSLNATEDVKKAVRTGRSIRFVPGKRDVSRKVCGVILIFYILRVVLTVACELPALQLYEFTGFVDNRTLDLTRFKNLFYILSSVLVLVFGAVFIYYTTKFFRSVRRDEEFCRLLEKSYSEYLELVPHVKIASNMITSAVFFVIGMMYSVLIFGSSIPIASGLFFAIFILISFILFMRYGLLRKLAVTSAVGAVLFAVLSFFDGHFQNIYYVVEDYGEFDPLHFSTAAKIYFKMSAVEALCYVISGAVFVLFTYAYYRSVLRDIDRLGVDSVYSGLPTYSAEEYRRELPRSVRVRFKIAVIFGILNFLFEASFRFFIFAPDFLIPVLDTLYFVFCVAWIISMIEFYRFIHSNIYYSLSDVERRTLS